MPQGEGGARLEGESNKEALGFLGCHGNGSLLLWSASPFHPVFQTDPHEAQWRKGHSWPLKAASLCPLVMLKTHWHCASVGMGCSSAAPRPESRHGNCIKVGIYTPSPIIKTI